MLVRDLRDPVVYVMVIHMKMIYKLMQRMRRMSFWNLHDRFVDKPAIVVELKWDSSPIKLLRDCADILYVIWSI